MGAQGLIGRAERAVQNCLPVLLTLILILLGAVPLNIAGYDTMMPLWALIAVYYWTIYRPDLMPAWAVFLLGLLQDLLGGGPVGLTALILVLMQSYCLSQRRAFATRSFLIGWLGFMLVAGGAAALAWAISSLYYLTLFRPDSSLAELALTIAVYPPLIWLFTRAEQRLLAPA